MSALSRGRACTAIAVSAILVATSFSAQVDAFDVSVEGNKVVAKGEPASNRRRFIFRGSTDVPNFSNPTVGQTTLMATEVDCSAANADDPCIATATSGRIALDPNLWLARGNPPGSRGYRYRDRSGSRGGIRAAVLPSSGRLVFKAVGADWPLVPTGNGTGVQVRLTRETVTYCADFGTAQSRNQAGWLSYGKAAPPPNCSGACGNGIVENDEGCDPPNGTTCDATCRLTCSGDSGSTLVACSSSNDPNLGFAGNGDDFILVYTQVAPERTRSRAVRFDSLGQVLDAPPLELSDGMRAASKPLAVVDDNGFHALWTTDSAVIGQRRRIPFAGLAFGPIESLGTNPPHGGGMCFEYSAGPFGLGAGLASGQPHVSAALVADCIGAISLTGVPGAGLDLSSSPIRADAPPASFARADSAVAAVWARVALSSPPTFSIQTNRMEPAPLPSSLQLTTIPSNVGTPVVAATGEQFLVVWATPTQIRGLRFTFPNALLDPNGGFPIATASGTAGLPAVASDGVRYVVAWRDRTIAHDELRAVRVGTDGVVESPPTSIATATIIADLGIAAGTSSTWAAFSTKEATGAYAMRIAEFP